MLRPKNGHAETIRVLKEELGADVNIGRKDGGTPAGMLRLQ